LDSVSPHRRECIAAESRQLISDLAQRPWSEETYLAGSAALALYLGHRPVQDLDLMTASNRLDGSARRDLLQDVSEFSPTTSVETARDGYLYLRVADGPALKIFYYPYPLVEPLEEFRGIAVASLLDLGLMKLAAVISRGARRDFTDLFLLCRIVPLADLLARADEKFGHVRDFPLQALKGLADLSLAKGEPMPIVEAAVEWTQIETWALSEVRRLGRQRLGLDGKESSDGRPADS
jgi:hypothetical protein